MKHKKILSGILSMVMLCNVFGTSLVSYAANVEAVPDSKKEVTETTQDVETEKENSDSVSEKEEKSNEANVSKKEDASANSNKSDGSQKEEQDTSSNSNETVQPFDLKASISELHSLITSTKEDSFQKVVTFLLESDHFYEIFSGLDQETQTLFFDQLTKEELYQFALYSKYAFVDTMISYEKKEALTKEDMSLFSSYVDLYEDVIIYNQKESIDPNEIQSLDQEVFETIIASLDKDIVDSEKIVDFTSYADYLQSLTTLDVSQILEQLNDFSCVRPDLVGKATKEFKNFIYAVYGFDELVEEPSDDSSDKGDTEEETGNKEEGSESDSKENKTEDKVKSDYSIEFHQSEHGSISYKGDDVGIKNVEAGKLVSALFDDSLDVNHNADFKYTILPEEGYFLRDIKIVNKKTGKPLSDNPVVYNRLSFEMPNETIQIEPVFEKYRKDFPEKELEILRKNPSFIIHSSDKPDEKSAAEIVAEMPKEELKKSSKSLMVDEPMPANANARITSPVVGQVYTGSATIVWTHEIGAQSYFSTTLYGNGLDGTYNTECRDPGLMRPGTFPGNTPGNPHPWKGTYSARVTQVNTSNKTCVLDLYVTPIGFTYNGVEYIIGQNLYGDHQRVGTYLTVPYSQTESRVAFNTQGGTISPVSSNPNGYYLPTNGYYGIQSRGNGNLFVHTANASDDTGTIITLGNGMSETYGRWYIERYKDTPYYTIVGDKSNKFLSGGSGGSTAQGANPMIKEQKLNDGTIITGNIATQALSPNQLWFFKKYANGSVSIHNKQNPRICLDVKGANFSVGTHVWFYTCTNLQDSPAQQFMLKPYATGEYYTKTKRMNQYLFLPTAPPVKKGYSFQNWNTASNGSGTAYAPGQNYTRDQDGGTVTLYAQWKPITYTVTYKGNGATGGSTANSTHTYNVAKALTANGFTRTNYIFKGWNTKADGSGTSYTNKQSVMNLTSTNGATITLYAQWTPVYYFDINALLNGTQYNTSDVPKDWLTYDVYINGSLKQNDVSDWADYYPAGTKYEIKDIKAKSGKKYIGVHKGSLSGTINSKTEVVLKVVTTHTNKIWHRMNGVKGDDGNSFLLGITDFTADYSSTYKMDASRAVKIPNGYILSNTFRYNNGGTYEEYTLGKTMTQKAASMPYVYMYDAVDYKITYNLDGGTNNAENPSKYNLLNGVTLKEPTKKWYTFEGWYLGDKKVTGINEGKNATFGSVDEMYAELAKRTTGDLTLTAKWKKTEIVVIYEGNGSDSGTLKSEVVSAEDAINGYDVKENNNFTSYTKKDSGFAGWDSDDMQLSYEASYKKEVLPKNISFDELYSIYESQARTRSTTSLTAKEAKALGVERNTPVATFYAVWDKAPELKPKETLEFYEGEKVTKEMLIDKIDAFDREDDKQNLPLDIRITKIEYSAGKLVDGEKQPAYTDSWKSDMPDDYLLDTWFLQMDKEDSPVSHKITYEVTDSFGNTTSLDCTIKVKYNEFPEIKGEDRYFTLEEAQAGAITAEELLSRARAWDLEDCAEEDCVQNHEPDKNCLDDKEKCKFAENLTLVGYDADEFQAFTESGFVVLNYKITDRFGKETVSQFVVYVVKDGETVDGPDVQYVRFINEKNYDKNASVSKNDLSEEELESLNQNGGLNIDSKWYTEEEYRNLLKQTFQDATSDELWLFEHGDIEDVKAYVEAHGVGNSQEAEGLSGFLDAFGTHKQ